MDVINLIKLIIKFINDLDKRNPNGSSNDPITIDPENEKNIKKLAVIIPTIFVIFSLISSFYTIEPGEVGVIQRFGKLSSYSDPGLHLKIPFVDKLTKVNVEKVRRIEIGFRSDRTRVSIIQESLMITKDENIVDAQAIIQWKVKDPGNYLFRVEKVEKTIKNTAEVALRSAMGVTLIDDALTTGRDEIQLKTREFLQELLDSYTSGVAITDVKLQIVDPPDEVKEKLVKENLKIIEISSVLAGPSVGMFFAELGAEVIKIENKITDGDITRKWHQKMEDIDKQSAYFSCANWGKKHVFLDFNDSTDKKKLIQLLKVADVLITNFKHGDAKKFNLTYKFCKSINDKIIYAKKEEKI